MIGVLLAIEIPRELQRNHCTTLTYGEDLIQSVISKIGNEIKFTIPMTLKYTGRPSDIYMVTYKLLKNPLPQHIIMGQVTSNLSYTVPDEPYNHIIFKMHAEIVVPTDKGGRAIDEWVETQYITNTIPGDTSVYNKHLLYFQLHGRLHYNNRRQHITTCQPSVMNTVIRWGSVITPAPLNDSSWIDDKNKKSVYNQICDW